MTNPPLKAALIPVTPLQQNCTLFWCTDTMRGAFVDPGGDLPMLKKRYGIDKTPAEIVLLQELERWNALVATMSDQLIDLRRALKGEIGMSDALDKLGDGDMLAVDHR